MANLSEFTQAVNSFSTGMKQFATDRAIGAATDQVNQLNAAVKDEGQKRAALTQLSNSLAMDLARIGTDPAQAQAAFKAVAPQQFGTVDQALLEGALTGSKDLLGRATQAQTAIEAPTQKRFDRQAAQTDRRIGNEELQIGMEAMKMQQSQASAEAQAKQSLIEQRGLNFDGTVGSLTTDQRQRFVPNVTLAPGKAVPALFPDKESAAEFKKMSTEAKPGLQALGRLKQMTALSRFSFKDRAVAEALVAQLRGPLRESVIGPGPVSENEQKILTEALADPTVWYSSPGAQRAKLDALESMITSRFRAQAEGAGVQFLAAPGDNETRVYNWARSQPPGDPKAQEVLKRLEQLAQQKGVAAQRQKR